MMDRLEFCDFDAAEFLDNEETIAAYLSDAMSDPDPEIFLSALGDAIRARSMTQLAEKSGLEKENLYSVMKPGSRPEYGTIAKILHALNVKMRVEPI